MRIALAQTLVLETPAFAAVSTAVKLAERDPKTRPYKNLVNAVLRGVGREGPGLTTAEKRAILASWASDASAIASCPSLRSPAGLKKPVSIDEILEALCELDGGPRNPPGGKPCRLRSTERALAA
ncbi:transcription antitermination factor NusB [uncultured Bradyrhizobium sp.]|uniref:transcription antitermination factor NusB n=1 Tax=uncultured Bradyrhizobium sp. TaxID=199684 RepID=UPI0026122B3D|nr:transcription antitermination factor NusB [uncultured Bradyrhizobium sp.]